MSRNYDNWERLVAAVIKRQQIWELCHQHSTTPSTCSEASSSDFSSMATEIQIHEAEWIQKCNPGVYIALVQLQDGTRDLKRVRFRHLISILFQTVAGLKTRLSVVTNEKLVLFEDSPSAFDLEELLVAPCFILGDEVSSAYVVGFKKDVAVVRYIRRGALLDQRWKTIQSLRHENVVRVRGFFISGRGGTFGISDYFHQGSLHTMLHGIKGENQVDLDWEARIRIAIGVAKGLLHIHKQSESFVHGSVKASNVFLNSQQYGCLDVKPDYDFSLENQMCHAPEVHGTKVVSQAGDVYSFGVVLIELVSGKSPLHYTRRHKTFADWVLHNARDKLTTMVFDREVVKCCSAKQAVWNLLGVASSCVRESPEERPKMNENTCQHDTSRSIINSPEISNLKAHVSCA